MNKIKTDSQLAEEYAHLTLEFKAIRTCATKKIYLAGLSKGRILGRIEAFEEAQARVNIKSGTSAMLYSRFDEILKKELAKLDGEG